MIFKAYKRAFQSLLDLKVLFLLAVPFLLATICIILLLILFWATWTNFLISTDSFQWLSENVGDNFFLSSIKFILILLATVFIFGPLWYLACILLISVFLIPVILPYLQKKFYPDLQKIKGSHFFGSLKNVIETTLIYLLLLALTVPFWMFTPIGPLISVVATAYLNKNIFLYDVLQDYASEKECVDFKIANPWQGWSLGISTAMISWVPIINFVAPSLTTLIFIQFYLGSLQEKRKLESPIVL